MKKLSLYIGFALLGLLMGATSSIAQTVKGQTDPAARKTAPNNTQMSTRSTDVKRNTPAQSNAKLNQAHQQQSQKPGTTQPATPQKVMQAAPENKKTAQPSDVKSK